MLKPVRNLWSAEVGGKRLSGNDDHSPILYKLKHGTDVAAVMKAAKMNGMKEVAFTTKSGDSYILQSKAMTKGLFGVRLPDVGEVVTIKDEKGATKLTGTITATDADWTRWLGAAKVGAGVVGAIAAGMTVIGAPVVGVFMVGAESLAMTAGTTAGAAGLFGVAHAIGKAVLNPNTVPDSAESAVQLT